MWWPEGHGSGGAEAEPASLDIDASAIEMASGETHDLHAAVLAEDGSSLSSDVTWSVADPSVGEVDVDGRLAAFDMGVTRVFARAGEVRDSVDLRVGQRVGGAGGAVHSRDGEARLDIPAGALDHEILVTILRRDDAGTDPALAGSAYDFVPEGASFSEPANLRLAYHEGDVDETVAMSRLAIHQLEPFGWEPLSPSAVDTTTRTVSAPIYHFSAYAVIAMAAVSSVEIVPDEMSLIAGEHQTLYAVLRDAEGGALERPLAWTTSDPAVATVASDGTVTAVSMGTVEVAATSEQVTGRGFVTVAREPVATLQMSPASLHLEVGGSATLTATPLDAEGNARDRSVGWVSADASVATVDGAGTVTALAAGTTTITATSEDVSASVPVSISGPSVAFVQITPGSLSLSVGSTAVLTATPKDANGNALDEALSWASSDASVAKVDGAGTVTALAVGTATITATSGSVSASVPVSISGPSVAFVQITPGSLSLSVGSTAVLTATPKDADGNALDEALSWASSDASVAKVDGAGTVTALAVGTATITATSGSVSASVPVAVVRPSVASVQITPGSVALPVGATAVLTATPKDADGNALDRPVTWQSTDTSVAAVDANGVVTGRAAGSVTIYAYSGEGSGAVGVDVSGDPLTWHPPSGWEGYKTYALPANGGDVRLDNDTDYLLANPTTNGGVISGTLTLIGGRNVVWIGGEIRIDTFHEAAEWIQSGLRLYDSNGSEAGRIIHVEGLLITGRYLADGIQLNAPRSVVQIQNVRAEPVLPYSNSVHPDVIQAWGGVGEARIDRLTGISTYQGLQLDATSSALKAPTGPIYIRRTNIRDRGSASSHKQFWWTAGQNSEIYLDQFYVSPAEGRDLGSAVWPSIYDANPLYRPVVTHDSNGTHLTWTNDAVGAWGTPAVRNWQKTGGGIVWMGNPAGGDFVTAASVGLGYVSPGYLP